MKNQHKIIFIGLIALIIGAMLGQLFQKSPDPPKTNSNSQLQVEVKDQEGMDFIRPRSQKRDKAQSKDSHLPPNAISDEIVLTFDDNDSLDDFLNRLKGIKGAKLLGEIRALRSLRLKLGLDFSSDDLKDLGYQYNYDVYTPNPGPGSIQDDAVGFGNQVLNWFGIEGKNVNWGSGVTVAVIDSGIAEHPTLGGNIQRIDLRSVAAQEGEMSGHGTAVASLIAGSHRLAPGVAPAVDLLSIAVTDSSGQSDTFTLSNAIVQAVDNGADFLNISMGTFGDSALLRSAIDYANENGAVIVAASGNNGIDLVAYPAAYDNVIAVGAIDANEAHLDFSNTGEAIDISAPGYALDAAWPNEGLVPFTGTSGAVPLVVATMAAVQSENNLSPAEAAEVVLTHANESGAPGADSTFGNGGVSPDWAVNYQTPNIVDAAAASQIYQIDGNRPSIALTYQNRGSDPIYNASVKVTGDLGQIDFSIPYIAPGEIFTQPIPVDPALLQREEGLTVQSQIDVDGTDARPDNDARTEVLRLAVPEEQP